MKWLHESYGRVTSWDSLSREDNTNLLFDKSTNKTKGPIQVDNMYLRIQQRIGNYFLNVSIAVISSNRQVRLNYIFIGYSHAFHVSDRWFA